MAKGEFGRELYSSKHDGVWWSTQDPDYEDPRYADDYDPGPDAEDDECPECNGVLIEGSAYCRHCGTKLEPSSWGVTYYNGQYTWDDER